MRLAASDRADVSARVPVGHVQNVEPTERGAHVALDAERSCRARTGAAVVEGADVRKLIALLGSAGHERNGKR